VCDSRIQAFIPLPEQFTKTPKDYGYPYTSDQAETINPPEYSCPHCFASDRDRLYALYFKKVLKAGTKYRLLDIAPSAPLRKFLKGRSNIVYRSADLFMQDVDDTGVDIMQMGYEDNSFDIFICSHVLEHVPDDRKAMRELRRILTPGGFGIAMVPIVLTIDKVDEDPFLEDVAERWRRFGQDDHVRIYSKQGFKDRLIDSGFKVEEVTITSFSEKEFLLYGISPKSVLYIVRK
jgi:SAM-dependent methyltransferase